MNNKGKYVEIIDDGSLQIYGVVRKGLTSGIGLDFKWEGTQLGVKREDQAEYEYVDLKADNALELTKESIIEALGYTPANIDDLIIHMTDLDIHVTEEEKQLITTIENKADKTYVDTINADLINRIKVLSDNHDTELKIINDNLTALDNNKLDIERYNRDQEDINDKLLTIPRKTSDLINDSDFVNSESPIFIGIQRQIDNLGTSKVDQNLFTLEIRRLEDMIAEIDTSGGVDLSEIKADIEDLKSNKADIAYVDQKVTDIHDKFMALLDLKVDKVIGKGLSTNDYTDDDKLKLASLTSIQKISDLEQDIPYLLSKDLDTIKQDISNNTTLINQEIARLEAKIDDIDIPDDEIAAIKLSIQNLEQLKADKSYVIAEVNRLELLINDLDPPEIDLSEIKTDVQNLKDTKADLSYVNSEIATVNKKIDDIVIPPEVDLTDIKKDILDLQQSKANKVDVESALAGKSDISHNHNDLYNTKDEIDSKLLSKQSIADKDQPNGYVGLDNNGKILLSRIPDTAKQSTYIVQSIEEMNDLTGIISGDRCFITTVGDSYIYDGSVWKVVAKADWENVNLDWGNIKNKPISTQVQIDDTVSKAHEHINKTVLDKITDDTISGIDSHINNKDIHISEDDRVKWNTVGGKADKSYVDSEIDSLSQKNNTQDIEISKKINITDVSAVGKTGKYEDILNKPTIPAEITKVSQLENDSEYITLGDIPTTDYPVTSVNMKTGDVILKGSDIKLDESTEKTISEKITEQSLHVEEKVTELHAKDNAQDVIIAQKASKSDIPTKLSQLEIDVEVGKNYDEEISEIQIVNQTQTEQIDGLVESGNAMTQSIQDLRESKADKSEIPTKLGQLTNDKGYITLAQVPETDLTGVNASISNLENIKADKTEIPTKVSSLENDSGFITSSAIPTSLPANGGNADTVGGFTVEVNVPANAKFTDTNTTYSEITTSEIDIGTATTLRTITGRRVQYILDKVGTMISTAISALNKSSVGLDNVDNTSDANKPISVATQKALDTKANKVDVTASLELKANKTDVPTKLSELNNDSGFVTQSSVPTKISNLTDDTSTQPVQFAERVQIKDTRAINDTPLDIMQSGKPSLKFDFKSRTSVGNPPVEISASASYAHILTVYGWKDSSGGYPTQISFGKDKVGIRTGTSNTEWSGWRIYSDDTVLNNIMKNYVDGEISALDSKKANKSDILSPYHLGSNPPTNTSVIWVKK